MRACTPILIAASCLVLAPSALAASAATTGGAHAGGAVASPTANQTVPPDPLNGTVPGTKGKIVKGIAYAPELAPPAVQRAIWAGNKLIGKPYVYGGGHADFKEAAGYDCSSTVSYALHGGDLLRSPLDSGSFMRWGANGKGRWITIYTNPGHAFVTIAGLRLDTSAADDPSGKRGPRWRPPISSTSSYVRRHPTGY